MGTTIDAYKNELLLMPINIKNCSMAKIKRFCLFFREDYENNYRSYSLKSNSTVLLDHIYKEHELTNGKEVTIYIPIVPPTVGKIMVKILVKFEEDIIFKDNEVKRYLITINSRNSVNFKFEEKITTFDSNEDNPSLKKTFFTLDSLVNINNEQLRDLKIEDKVFMGKNYERLDKNINEWTTIDYGGEEKMNHKYLFSSESIIKQNSISNFFGRYTAGFNPRKKSMEISELRNTVNLNFIPENILNDPFQEHIKKTFLLFLVQNFLIFQWSCLEKNTDKKIEGLVFQQVVLKSPKMDYIFLKNLLKTICNLTVTTKKIEERNLVNLKLTMDLKGLKEYKRLLFVNISVQDKSNQRYWIGTQKYKITNGSNLNSNENIINCSFNCVTTQKGKVDINQIVFDFNLKEGNQMKVITVKDSPHPVIVYL